MFVVCGYSYDGIGVVRFEYVIGNLNGEFFVRKRVYGVRIRKDICFFFV